MRPLDPDTVETRLRAAIDAGDAAEIDRLGAWLDRHEPARGALQLLASALWYALAGLPVFPLRPHAKVPLPGSHGCKDATTDTTQIRTWWTETPEANIGIATGHLIDVIDIDGQPGNISWARAMYDEDDVYVGPPALGMVTTPRAGGRHLYIAADPKTGNRANLLPHVDYRGTGGYVVAPPSATDVGTYLWRKPLDLNIAEVVA